MHHGKVFESFQKGRQRAQKTPGFKMLAASLSPETVMQIENQQERGICSSLASVPESNTWICPFLHSHQAHGLR